MARKDEDAGYDEDLDVVVRELGEVKLKDAKTYLTARVMAYNGGPEKVSIDRWTTAKDTHTKLGRLSIEEAKALGKLLRGVKA